jgi:hypothetical protein
VKSERGVDTRHRRLGLLFLIRCEKGALLAAGLAESAASRDDNQCKCVVVVIKERLR